MDKGIHDIAVDMLRERLADAKTLIAKEYKGVRPFRYTPPPERESLYYYMNLTDEQKQFGRQSFGTAYDVYEQKMEQLREKYNG